LRAKAKEQEDGEAKETTPTTEDTRQTLKA